MVFSNLESNDGSDACSDDDALTRPRSTTNVVVESSSSDDEAAIGSSPDRQRKRLRQTLSPSPFPTSKQCKRKNNDTGWQCPNTITVAHKTRGFCDEHWDFILNKSIRCAKTTAKPAKRSSPARIQNMPTCPDTTPAPCAGSAIRHAILLGSAIDDTLHGSDAAYLPAAAATNVETSTLAQPTAAVGEGGASVDVATAARSPDAVLASAETSATSQFPMGDPVDFDPIPEDFVALPGKPFPWHNPRYPVTAWHLELGLGGRVLCFVAGLRL